MKRSTANFRGRKVLRSAGKWQGVEDGFRSVSGPTVIDALDRCMSTQIDIDSTDGPYVHLKRIAIVNLPGKVGPTRTRKPCIDEEK